eukprot:CAMPEP_0194051394 /NCGR_PEP_ID=MMETSP0009_2-20130614/40237_1 /TAXON_ID=210454 /ORGANISM="Grammatophora oceanica, Strain CCMP 410" /LENGTH=32 /DNA_ID= /DNA_START= /DNA_END= /DNA_ORIENTATION=
MTGEFFLVKGYGGRLNDARCTVLCSCGLVLST